MRAPLLCLATILCLSQGLPTIGQPAVTAAQNQAQLEAMEKKFFEHDFSKEPSEYRLGRLEKFAFGQTSSLSNDARMKRLQQVIDLHPHLIPAAQTPFTTKSATAATPPARPLKTVRGENGDPVQSTHYPHVTNLEQTILKRTYEDEPIGNRLNRLESRVFGTTKPNVDFATRTDALEDFAETTLHQKAYAINPENDGDSQVLEIRPKRKIFGEPMQSITGLQGDPEEEQDPDSKTPAVDPAVLSDTPPSSHARLLTRVAWCEQHLYGHTFPNLHLMNRLHQINATLFPEDHEPDIKLMDRIDLLVKHVVMMEHPPLASAAGL